MFQQISKSASALFGKADYELSSPLIKQSIAEYADKVTQGKKKEKVRNSSWCYKTFFGGNLDIPKIKKLNKVCFNVWTCTKYENYSIFKENYTPVVDVLKLFWRKTRFPQN